MDLSENEFSSPELNSPGSISHGLRKALVSSTNKMLVKVPGFDSLEGQRRSTMMAVAWGLTGLILLATLAISTVLFSGNESTEEVWTASFFNSGANGTCAINDIIEECVIFDSSLGPGESVTHTWTYDDNATLAISAGSMVMV